MKLSYIPSCKCKKIIYMTNQFFLLLDVTWWIYMYTYLHNIGISHHHNLALSMYLYFYNTLTMCSKLSGNEMLINHWYDVVMPLQYNDQLSLVFKLVYRNKTKIPLFFVILNSPLLPLVIIYIYWFLPTSLFSCCVDFIQFCNGKNNS
jgi:hypothetical protein